MANTNIDLVGLDFNSLKNNLKTFLKNNTQFKDLDYEGSNINVLLDLLSYNTYLNNFYTNMVASEMFLDTAQLRDSIVSHAKELNYVPRSFNSSKATITVDLVPLTTVSSIVVPAYTSFTSRVGSNTYTFSTQEATVITSSNNGVFSLSTDVYEGIITTESFVINQANAQSRNVLSNPTIDTSSLSVTVYEDGGQTEIAYSKADTLIQLGNTSKVYFLQAAENQQYELVFGDGIYGRKPKDGSIVSVKYRACSGELPNGAFVFAADGPIDGHTDITITTTVSAVGGAVSETNESIRFNAPRAFQAQNRAVTASDYETLLLNQFADIQSISVYGGEDNDPPKYGQVFISVDVANADGAPESRKKVYYDYIKDKTPLTIGVEFINPSFTYFKIVTNVEYDINSTSKTSTDIKTAVQAAISGYNTTYLDGFNKSFRASKLTESIDAADASIISSEISVLVVKRVVPLIDSKNNIVITVDAPLETEQGLKISTGETHYGHTLHTSTFTYQGVASMFVDDTLGNVYVAALQGDTIQIITKVGTIDYALGKVTIADWVISAYAGNYVEFEFRTLSSNYLANRNNIVTIDTIDVVVNVTGIKI